MSNTTNICGDYKALNLLQHYEYLKVYPFRPKIYLYSDSSTTKAPIRFTFQSNYGSTFSDDTELTLKITTAYTSVPSSGVANSLCLVRQFD